MLNASVVLWVVTLHPTSSLLFPIQQRLQPIEIKVQMNGVSYPSQILTGAWTSAKKNSGVIRLIRTVT